MDDIRKTIDLFIADRSQNLQTNGCLICGSYASGNYTLKSDIDILFLVPEHPFEMVLLNYNGKLFDQLISDYKILQTILTEESFLSNVLSLSFGLAQITIMPSEEINIIIKTAKNNISERNLTYKKDNDKKDKIVNGKKYNVCFKDGKHFLIQDNVIIA